jgi:hypothetical protein
MQKTLYTLPAWQQGVSAHSQFTHLQAHASTMPTTQPFLQEPVLNYNVILHTGNAACANKWLET